MAMENVARAEAAEVAIRVLLKECAEGLSDRESEALAKAEEGGIAADWVEKSFATARKVWAEAETKQKAEVLAEAARIVAPLRRRKVAGTSEIEAPPFYSRAQPTEEPEAEAQPEPEASQVNCWA